MEIVGKCHICEINIYDRGDKNRTFKTHLGVMKKGYPSDVSLPCGLDRTTAPPNKEMSKGQYARCPFETKEQQDLIEYKKSIGVISGGNTWDGIV
jgi:hypothetical protein